MSRIVEVCLDGFKGQNRTFELSERNVLTGPNGLGKSSVLEGIRYALSGEVPTGKSLDEVAKYFPPRGGSVAVRDEAGSWIRRGISRDHEKAKVSEFIEEEGGAEWVANAALLNMRGFLALSANKRREFVLDLVGAGETPQESDIRNALAKNYAQEIAGPGADVSILNGRSVDLPDEIRPLAENWLSMWGVLASFLKTGEQSASGIFQRLAGESKERKNLSRRAAIEAKAAIRELEAAAKGARAAAAEIEQKRYAAEEAADAFAEARAVAAKRAQALKAVELAEKDRAHIAELLKKSEAEIASLKDPGPHPEISIEEPAELSVLRERITRECDRIAYMSDQRRDLERASDALELAKKTLKRSEDGIESLKAEPIARAAQIAADIKKKEIPLGGLVGKLVAAVEELSKSWHERYTAAMVVVLKDGGKVTELTAKHDALRKESLPEGTIEETRQLVQELSDKAADIETEYKKHAESQREELQRWEEASLYASEVGCQAKALRERYTATRARHQALSADLEAMLESDVTAAEASLQEAKEALQKAEEASGAVKAYEEAVSRAKWEQIREKAWKAAEVACKRSRETYVAEVVAPLTNEMGAILAACGRQERVYVDLENDRGKPIFDIGWILDTSKRSLSALSGGEAVLFTAALALVIARRAGGRRVLLIEADPLDDANLTTLFRALAKIHDDLDACLVATSTDTSGVWGWNFIEFNTDGSIQEVACV